MLPDLLGSHPTIRSIRRSLPDLGSDRELLMILGPPGAGKTLIARHVHDHSDFRNNDFLFLDAALLDDHDQRIGLFGGEPPILTTTRQGILERSTTVVLKHAEHLRPYLQQDLAEAITSEQTRRPGATGKRDVLCRIVFIFRLHPVILHSRGLLVGPLMKLLRRIRTLRVPALRFRKGDAPLLAASLLKVLSAGGIRVRGTTKGNVPDPALRRFLTVQSWPGNVPQLNGFLKSLALMPYGELVDARENLEVNIMLNNVAEGRGFSLEESMRAIELSIVHRAMEQSHGNIRRAARLLGMTESAMHRRKSML